MKSVKLLAALLSIGAVAAKDEANAANVSTITVANPVSTRTHTSIVFVTATAGSVTNTCLASVCESDNSTTTSLSTIRLTSFTTSTTTDVVTPPDVTTTVTSATSGSILTSCAMEPPSTITVTVTETSLPVITRSVYPVAATTLSSKTETQIPPYRNVTSRSYSSTMVPSPPYLNMSVTYTMTYTSTFTMTSPVSNTTEYMYTTSNVLGVPGMPIHMTATANSSGYSGTAPNGSSTTSGGWYLASNARAIKPPRFFSLFAKVLSLSGFVGAQSTRVLMSEGNEPEALSDICVLQDYMQDGCPDIPGVSQVVVPRVFSYSAPSYSAPRQYVVKKDVSSSQDSNATTTTVPGTILVTSTIVNTVTQQNTVVPAPSLSLAGPGSLVSLVSSATTSPADISQVSGVSTPISTDATSPAVSSNISSPTSSIIDAQPNSAGVPNFTISVTITQAPNTTLTSVFTTLTDISHITEIDHAQTTSTTIETVSQTFASFTGGVAPSATGRAARLGLSVSYIALVVAFALVVSI